MFFAVETLLLTEKDYDSRGDSTPGLTIAMVLLASVLAAVASQAGLGSTPSVRVPDYELVTPLELPLILVFGACCGLVSASCTYSNKVTCPLCWGPLSGLVSASRARAMQLSLVRKSVACQLNYSNKVV